MSRGTSANIFGTKCEVSFSNILWLIIRTIFLYICSPSRNNPFTSMNYRNVFLLNVFLAYLINASAQSGCIDPQANNYDPTAIVNDGSCLYQQTSLPLAFHCFIDAAKLDETSGIMKLGNDFWTHVDDTDNSIYRIDTESDSIFQKVTILNSTNQDWEDMFCDDNYIYIGDIGNNGGNRHNLRYYRIDRTEVDSTTTSVNAEKIKFTYSDQTVFNTNNGNYYDCEAFIVLHDTIHMFTKGWRNRWTKHYMLPAIPGTQVAQLVDSFNVDGLITSAAIQGDSLVVLLGLNYVNGSKSFVWTLSGFTGSDFFGGNKRRFEIGNINNVGQVEAICFSDTNKCFITNEELSATPSQIREVDLNPFMINLNAPVGISNPVSEDDFQVYPNPFAGNTNFDYTLQKPSRVSIEVFNAVGERIVTLADSEAQQAGSHSYQIRDLSPGIYFLRFSAGKSSVIRRIVSM